MNNLEMTYFLARLLLTPINKTLTKQLQRHISTKSMEWEKIIEIASNNLITSALYTSFNSMNMFHALPEDLQAYLIEIHQRNTQRNREIKEQVLEIASLFNKIGVAPLFLKGVANLFYDIYPDQADRIMHDADILVPKERLLDCVHVLKRNGYYSTADEELFNEKSHHYIPLISDQKPVVVELHRYPISTQYDRICSQEEFWDSSVTKTVKDGEFRLPSPTDHIKHHIIHAHQHYGMYGNGVFFLRGFHDFVLLCIRFETHINWSLLEAYFDQADLKKEFESYLLFVNRFCGYQEPLQHVKIKNTRQLLLYQMDLHLIYPVLFELWKLFDIATKRERRKDFIEKLKNPKCYARQLTRIRDCFWLRRFY